MGRAPCCEKAEVKKGPWSIHEDRILMNYIALHGHPNWRALPKQAGLKRCGKSCRLRWFNYLKPDIKRGNFTREEEEAIINLHQLLGNKWSAIAARLPGRTDNEIKNVWHTHLKKRLIVINSNKDDDDDDDDDDHKKQQQPPASSTETYASSSSSPDSSGDQASSSSKSTVDDYLGSTTFPEIDHTFLSQVLSDDQYSDFSSTDPIFAAAAQDQYSSSSSSSDTDDQFWYNLYTTAAAEAATAGGGDDHYSLGHNLPDTITFDDSLIHLPL